MNTIEIYADHVVLSQEYHDLTNVRKLIDNIILPTFIGKKLYVNIFVIDSLFRLIENNELFKCMCDILKMKNVICTKLLVTDYDTSNLKIFIDILYEKYKEHNIKLSLILKDMNTCRFLPKTKSNTIFETLIEILSYDDAQLLKNIETSKYFQLSELITYGDLIEELKIIESDISKPAIGFFITSFLEHFCLFEIMSVNYNNYELIEPLRKLFPVLPCCVIQIILTFENLDFVFLLLVSDFV